MAPITRRDAMLGGAAVAGSLAVRPLRAADAGDGVSGPVDDAVEAAVQESIAAGGAPGIQIGIARAGTMLAERGYGMANLETGTAMTGDSILRIGSLTKQFTAAAAIKLGSQGVLDLNASIGEVLEAFSAKPPVSALELIHHTAGLHEAEEGGPVHPDGAASTQIDLANAIAAQEALFDFAPGKAWLYSNSNYIVLGALIEQATGKPLAAAMHDLLFAPLALSHTALDSTGDVVPGRASGYSPSEASEGGYRNGPPVEVADSGGAGAMRSTVADLCRWHHELLAGQVLDRRGLETMLAPGRLRDGRLSGENRFSPDDASYGDTQYAGGLLVTGPSEARRTILHYGYFYGFSALLQTWLDDGLTLAVLCNCDPGPALPFRGVRRAVIARYLDEASC